MDGTLFIRFSGGDDQGVYRLAGRTVVTRPSLPDLQPFRVREGDGERGAGIELEHGAGEEPATFVRRVSGLVGDRERTVICWSSTDGGYRLEVEGIGSFRLGRRGEHTVIETDLPASGLAVAAALGPVLAVALAWSGVWILHASAVARLGRVVPFLGPGGIGKSTLGRHLASGPGGVGGGPWRPVADDLLPVRLSRDGLEALPRVPQPRWSRDAQGGPVPETAPVPALFHLGRGGPGDAAPECRRLTGREAAAALIHQTIGASLLDGRLLARHLELCGRAAETVPAFALTYPLERDHLPRVGRLIEERLRSLARPSPGA